MAAGPWYIFNHWLQNIADGGGNIFTGDVYAILCKGAQNLDRTFVGASTDCRYADITDELPTASGYTLGGVIIPAKTVIRTAGAVVLDSDPWSWTFSAGVTGAKYCVLYAQDSTNLDLVGACLLDSGGGTVTIIVGPVEVAPVASGIIKWEQP